MAASRAMPGSPALALLRAACLAASASSPSARVHASFASTLTLAAKMDVPVKLAKVIK